MTFCERLLSLLSSLEETFHPNELAYLAATSKVEGPIRDRIAYGLHAQLEKGLLIHREWNSRKGGWTDIAVTDEDNQPKYLLELKAHSGPTFEPGYSSLIRKDCQKLSRAGNDNTELYLVFLFNHLHHPSVIDLKYQYAIKYFNLQNFASRQNLFAADVSEPTKTHWERHLTNIGLPIDKSHPGIRISAGEYHEMPMSVHAFVYGPVYRRELEKISTGGLS